jgi:hypothetical protein
MDKFLANYQSGKLGLTMAILLVLAGASGMFTYNGASLDAETFLEKARATVFALAGSSAIYLFWHYVLKIVPNLTQAWHIILAMIVTLTWCVMIFFISSSFNVTAFAGKDALELHLSRYIGELETTIGAQFKQAIIVESAVSDLRMEAAHYKDAATREFETGFYSGDPGPGAVHNALLMIEIRLSGLEGEASAFLAEVDTLSEAAKGRLEKIRQITSSERALSRRMRDISRESNALRMDLARMDSRNLSQSISRTMQGLPSEVDMQTVFSSNGDTAKRQKVALDKVRSEISRSALALSEFMSVSSAEPAASMAAFEKMSPGRAVQVYWKNFIPFWAGGIALDIAPLAVVLFLMIGLHSKTSGELARGALSSMTLQDLIRAKAGADALRRASIDAENLKSMNDDIFGRKNITGNDDGKEGQ